MYTKSLTSVENNYAIGENFIFPDFPAGDALLVAVIVDAMEKVEIENFILSFNGNIISNW